MDRPSLLCVYDMQVSFLPHLGHRAHSARLPAYFRGFTGHHTESDTTDITAPFWHQSVTERSVALPPDLTGGVYARSANANFIASRRAPLSQMPVAHGGPACCLSTLSSTGPYGTLSAGLSTRRS